MIQVLVTDYFTPQSLAYLNSNLKCKIIQSQSKTPTAEELANVDALLIRSRTKIHKEILELAPKLKLIITATSGFDHIDFNATKNKTVMYTPLANVNSVLELTFLAMLNLARNYPQSVQAVKDSSWKDSLPLAEELYGKTLTLIGLGRIGRQVAKMSHGFGLHVQAFDPYVDDEVFENLKVTRLGFIESLRSADIISLHVPYTKKTHNFINDRTLLEVPTHAFLINTSRGKVVEEEALYNHLLHKKLRGAFLDVFANEPIDKSHKLLTLKNLITTPHIGAYTQEAFSRASLMAVDKLINFFAKGELADALPPQEEWYQEEIK